MELTSDGQTALFGTVDGRVLVRTITGKRNWDVYARDLFLFQDEIRTISRLSDNAIVVLRELSSGRFLSIDVKVPRPSGTPRISLRLLMISKHSMSLRSSNDRRLSGHRRRSPRFRLKGCRS